MKNKFVHQFFTFWVLLLFTFPAFTQEEEKASSVQGYVAWEDVVQPSNLEDYETAVKFHMGALAQLNYPFSVSVYQISDYTYIFTTPIKKFGDIDRIYDAFGEMNKSNEDLVNKIDETYEGTYEYTTPGVFTYSKKLSYLPEEPLEGLKDAKFFYWGRCYVKQGKSDEIADVFAKFVDLYREKNIPRGFQTFYGNMGFETPFMFWVTYDNSPADLWANSKKFNEILGEEGEQLWTEFQACLRKFEFKTGWYREDLSYYPPAEE